MTLDPDLHGGSRGGRSLRDLMHGALDLPVEERRAYVEARLPEGTALADALALLSGLDEVDGFLEAPIGSAPGIFRPALPERIGGFVIERVIGYGSMGVVYLARQVDPTRMVAVKLLRIDQASAASIDRFKREAAALARLSHQSIARVYEAGVANLGAGEQPWFAMEYVDGARLLEHAREARLDRRARVALVVEIARAVQHAHEQGVVHRDLKPDNVLVRKVGAGGSGRAAARGEHARSRMCVLDFGVAQLACNGETFASLTVTGQVMGTLAYMAPEQARGGAVDARVDQFALGAMLYELLTGEVPLAVRGKLMHEALRVVADGQWTPASLRDRSLAGDLEAILGTALAPEANRRYASVGAFADDLERWLAGRPVVARTPRLLEAVARLVRRRPLATVGSALAASVVAVIVAFIHQARSEQQRSSAVALLFSDRSRYGRLVAEAEHLWPANSARVPALDAWLTEARGLVERVERHRATLGRLAEQGRGAFSGRGGALDRGRQGAEYLEPFEGLADGLLAELSRRRDLAARLYSETVTRYAAAWASAAERVARDPRFEGFVLAPQEGLVPLGPDPGSGLEEFAAFATGSLPVREPVTGLVRPRLGDALTFVLIPGGERHVGFQITAPDGPNFVQAARIFHVHGPPVGLVLDPFLISKFELTQDQFERSFGVNPSYNVPGKVFEGVETTPLHPIETVSWERHALLLARLGMTLPTEAQWEVAALGGGQHAFVWGPAFIDLAGCANTMTYDDSVRTVPPFPDDGYYGHSPVGTFRANAHGLHDVIGNVSECCLDSFALDYHELPHREGDGLVVDQPSGMIVRRGGTFTLPPTHSFVYLRDERLPHAGDGASGVRPLWPLTGPSTGVRQAR